MSRSGVRVGAARIDRADVPGMVVNALMRIAIVVFTVDSIVNAADDRFQGKALGPRNLIILFGFAMLFPVLYRLVREWTEYPWWFDNVYLSIFAVDMLGNFLNLYNAWEHWDHIPHFHGPGALSVVMMGAFAISPLAAAGFATILHVLLEIQEFYGDVVLGTKNVRDQFDSMNDLLFGIFGAALYVVIYKGTQLYRERHAHPRKTPSRSR